MRNPAGLDGKETADSIADGQSDGIGAGKIAAAESVGATIIIPGTADFHGASADGLKEFEIDASHVNGLTVTTTTI